MSVQPDLPPLRPCELCAIEDIYEESFFHARVYDDKHREATIPTNMIDEADLCTYHKTAIKDVAEFLGRFVVFTKLKVQ